ncbi:serine/threonine-protein kinase haspin [Aphelenchoides avenae]|nr:serine/threonine-protein kinase haspin [Aphelenchus avenae]
MENLQNEFDDAENFDAIVEDATPPDRFLQDDKSPSASLDLSAQDQLPFYLLDWEGERTDLNELLHPCQQHELLRYEERFARKTFAKAVKIGEGSYVEVFKVSTDCQPCAIKVIPFRDQQFPAYARQSNGDYQNYTSQMHPAVVMLTVLSKLRDCDDSQAGCMTPGFVKLCAAWDTVEERLPFEHGHLHEGDILADKTSVNETIRFEFIGTEGIVKTHGVKATIIDFAHSRISKGMAGGRSSRIGSRIEDLFVGQGSYQFDTYRMVREHNK